MHCCEEVLFQVAQVFQPARGAIRKPIVEPKGFLATSGAGCKTSATFLVKTFTGKFADVKICRTVKLGMNRSNVRLPSQQARAV